MGVLRFKNITFGLGIPLELFNEHYECKLKEESSHDK